MRTERRRRRSSHLAEALRFYLESLASRYQLAATALATKEGDLVTGTGDEGSIQDLAVLGALSVERPGAVSELAPDLQRHRNFHVTAFEVEGYPLRLAALGASGPSRAEIAPAVRRILHATG